MSRIQYINNEIEFKVITKPVRKLVPGFKFAVGDKLRMIKKPSPSAYADYQIGDIVTVKELCFPVGSYRFKEDTIEPAGPFNTNSWSWGQVEQNFELVSENE